MTKKRSKAQAALDRALALYRKENKDKQPIQRIGEIKPEKVRVISSGISVLDGALGVGGWPMNRMVEISGPEGGGKTTLALEAVRQCQAAGGTVGYLDAEHALNVEYAEALGVNVNEMVLIQEDSAEDSLDRLRFLVGQGALTMCVIDSMAALTPQAELDRDMTDQQPGMQAKLIGKFCRVLRPLVHDPDSGCAMLLINQLREKIGQMYGNPEYTPGGRALKFYCDVRLSIRKSAWLTNGESKDPADRYGMKVKIQIVKNRLARPYRIVTFDLIWGEGFDAVGSLLQFADEIGAVQRSGSWYSMDGNRLGQGYKKVRQLMYDDSKLKTKIQAAVDEILRR